MITLTSEQKKHIDNYFNHSWYFTSEAWIIQTTTGSISTLSSALIMSIILRSQSKLSSPYHRIMFFMSFWDAIASSAMALTTIPMPIDVIYPYAGNSYGNEATCSAQGFAIILAQAFTVAATCSLSLYYVCTIRYGMTDDTANKRLLPILLTISALAIVPMAGVPLWLGLYNPRIFDTHCEITLYPWRCDALELECIGGADASKVSASAMSAILASLIFVALVYLIISFVLVVVSIFQTEAEEKNTMEESQREEDDNDLNANSSHINGYQFHKTKNARRLALMYIGAFLVTWIWSLVMISLGSLMTEDFSPVVESSIFWYICNHGKQVCKPLQGFFNATIFIYNKMCLLRDSEEYLEGRNHDGNDECHRFMSFFLALKTVVVYPSKVPEVIVSNIEVVGGVGVHEGIEGELGHNQNLLVNDEEGMISEAEIPSSFESNRTPSLELSNAISKDGLDERMDKKFKEETEMGDPSKKRLFYTLPADFMFEGEDAYDKNR